MFRLQCIGCPLTLEVPQLCPGGLPFALVIGSIRLEPLYRLGILVPLGQKLFVSSGYSLELFHQNDKLVL